MLAALLSLLGTLAVALAPVLGKWLLLRLNQSNDPKTIRQRNHEQVTEEVRRDDADAANARLDKWLRDAGGGDRRGQTGAPREARPDDAG